MLQERTVTAKYSQTTQDGDVQDEIIEVPSLGEFLTILFNKTLESNYRGIQLIYTMNLWKRVVEARLRAEVSQNICVNERHPKR